MADDFQTSLLIHTGWDENHKMWFNGTDLMNFANSGIFLFVGDSWGSVINLGYGASFLSFASVDESSSILSGVSVCVSVRDAFFSKQL